MRTGPVVLPSLALIALCLLLPLPAGSAMAPLLEWETVIRAFPESGPGSYEVMHDAVPDGDGGIVAAGYAIPADGYTTGAQEALVARLDALGNERWRTFLGDGLAGSGEYSARRVRRTPDGGFVVACTAFLWRDRGENVGLYYNRSFVAKLDANGAQLWRYDFDPLSLDEVGDIDVLPDGSVLAAGRVWENGGATFTAVAKLSPAGGLLWMRKESPGYIQGVLGAVAAPDGGLFVTSGGGVEVTLARYAPDGGYLWSTVVAGLDGEDSYADLSVHGMTAGADGGCIVTGGARTVYWYSIYGAFRPFSVAFDASGRQRSTLLIPGTSTWLHAVERLPDGGFIAAEGPNSSNNGSVFVRYDRQGGELWRASYGALSRVDGYVEAIRNLGDGRLAAVGAIEGTDGTWALDGSALMLDGGGVPIGGGDPEPPRAVKIDVLPGSADNPVNPGANGLLPVALLSAPGFDASRVDPATVMLEGAPVARKGRGEYQAVRKDVDRDGRADLLLFFSVPSLRLSPESTQVTMVGIAPGGTAFSATDRIRIVGLTYPFVGGRQD
jgi:hypothetical protein